MISEAFAKTQIMRVSGLRYFPDHEMAQKELVSALRKVAKDDSHAKEIIGDWVEENEEAPKPVHFYRIAEAAKHSNHGIRVIPIAEIS